MNKKLGNRIKSSGHEQTRERVEKDIIFVKNNSKFEILFLETVLPVAVISKSQFNTTKKCTPPPLKLLCCHLSSDCKRQIVVKSID